MKLTPWLLAASLAANALLAAFLLLGRPSGPAAAATPGTASAQPGTVARRTVSVPVAGPANQMPGHTAWAQLGTDDLSALVPRLRAAGFPPRIVRGVVIALVAEQFDRRRLALESDNLAAPLVANNANAYMDPKIGAEFRRLQREQTEATSKLLGEKLNVFFADSEENQAILRHQIGDIPGDKIDRLYAAAMDFNDKTAQIYAAANSGRTMVNADREKLMEFEAAYRTELDKFLTPTEANDFMMHGSMTGTQLRTILAPFQPTENEYRTLFPIYQEFQRQFPSQATALPPDQAAARKIAEDQMTNVVTGLLGAERAADFKQAIDPSSSQLNRLVARLELPMSAATQVAAIQRDTQTRVSAVSADPALSAADRTTQFAQLAQDASNKISQALGGQRGLDAYKQYGGQWLQSLTPKPPAPKPKG
jgi:hypothetical protein